MHSITQPALQQIPSKSLDRMALNTIAHDLLVKLANKLTVLQRIDLIEVAHVITEFVLSFAKINIWTAFSQEYEDDPYQNLKVAAAFVGFIGILPQLISVIKQKISYPELLSWQRFIETTLPQMVGSALVPLSFFRDAQQQVATVSLQESGWQALRLIAVMGLVDKMAPLIAHDSIQLIKKFYHAITNKLAENTHHQQGYQPLAATDASTIVVINADSDTVQSPEAMQIKNIIEKYDNLPLLFLVFVNLFFGFINTNPNAEAWVQDRFGSNPFGFGNLATFISMLLASLACALHAKLNS